MRILVSGGGVFLDEADSFNGFKIASDLNDESIERKLRGAAGYRDDRGLFWIRREWIVAQAPSASESRWQESFGKVEEFAASRGWIDPVKGAIRARVERADSGAQAQGLCPGVCLKDTVHHELGSAVEGDCS
jgi:hypothetical protein